MAKSGPRGMRKELGAASGKPTGKLALGGEACPGITEGCRTLHLSQQRPSMASCWTQTAQQGQRENHCIRLAGRVSIGITFTVSTRAHPTCTLPA